MGSSAWMLTITAVLICGNAVAQGQANRECLRVRVEIDGHTINDPSILYVGDGRLTDRIDLSARCPQLPIALQTVANLQTRIDIGENTLLLGQLSRPVFDAPWDIALTNKRDSNREACRLVIHEGDPEQGLLIRPCRRPKMVEPKL